MSRSRPGYHQARRTYITRVTVAEQQDTLNRLGVAVARMRYALGPAGSLSDPERASHLDMAIALSHLDHVYHDLQAWGLR